ncbi:hypothetical protein SLITO_v1c10800 [Spiroplasma litorale]|uniref:Lipoprotein n=1 Tax=Spiroplasma litorale TaxID=216942 RepID=A0A0K1W3C4_9MOLU|nr:hypothetical protein [Spiroplasma litorale]AKX34691.1 hypothetical protein SLITO_v1c10800 [Spiroplasma litorale]
MKKSLFFYISILMVCITSIFLVSCGSGIQKGDSSGWGDTEPEKVQPEISKVENQTVAVDNEVNVKVKVKNAFELNLRADIQSGEYAQVWSVDLDKNSNQSERNKTFIVNIKGYKKGVCTVNLEIGSVNSTFSLEVIEKDSMPIIIVPSNVINEAGFNETVKINVVILNVKKDEKLIIKEQGNNSYFEDIKVTQSQSNERDFEITVKTSNKETFKKSAVLELSYPGAKDRVINFVIYGPNKKAIEDIDGDLKEIISEVKNASYSSIINKINEIYSGLYLRESDIDLNNSKIESNKKAYLVISSESQHYKGTKNLNYLHKWDIDFAIETKDLGYLRGNDDTPSNKEIINKINELNKDLNITENDVNITVDQDYGAKLNILLESKETSENFANNTFLQLEYFKQTDINNVVKNKYLGILKDTGEKPLLESLLNKITALNNVNDLKIEDYFIKENSLSNNEAIILCSDNNLYYYGEFKVTFKYYKCIDLAEYIDEYDLGKIKIQSNSPTLKELISYIEKVNPGKTLDEKELNFSFESNDEAKIIANENSLKYISFVVVWYEIDK